jgi:septum formation protein
MLARPPLRARAFRGRANPSPNGWRVLAAVLGADVSKKLATPDKSRNGGWRNFAMSGIFGRNDNRRQSPFDYEDMGQRKKCARDGHVYKTGMKLVLGSASKYRKAILESMGYRFDVALADIDEQSIRSDDYYELPLLLARAKADALLGRVGADVVIITADQVVVCNRALYEKPKDEQVAKAYLAEYGRGHPAETVSALVVTNSRTGVRAEGVDIARVYYHPIPDAVVDAFVRDGDPFSKAGGFEVQSPILRPYLKAVEGAEDSVMGMPLGLLDRLITKVSL